MKKMTLTYHRTPDPSGRAPAEEYRVDHVVGSVDYHPGQLLSKSQVRDLCDQTGSWIITIKGPGK